MIHSERWGVWETNSSSMNQIVIHLVNDVSHVITPKRIELNHDIDDSGGMMYSEFTDKAKIIYAITEQLKYEADHECSNMHDAMIKWADTYLKTLFEVLNSHGIEYTITESEMDISELEMFGLCGVHEIRGLDDFETVEKFLFDPASAFTFGYENHWPDNESLGYTGVRISNTYYSAWNI